MLIQCSSPPVIRQSDKRLKDYQSHKWDRYYMPFTRVDNKGRVVLPNELRRKLDINPGDEFAVEVLAPDSVILKKVDLRSLVEEMIEKAKTVDLEKLEAEIEEEANKLARQKYKVLD